MKTKKRKSLRHRSRVVGPEIMPGVPMTIGLRQLLDIEVERAIDRGEPGPPNPYGAGELSQFIEWLQEVPTYSSSGLPRYVQAIYNERRDLLKGFPEVAAGELGRFDWWAKTFARAENPSMQVLGHKFPVIRTVREGGRISGGVDVVGFLNAEHGIGEAARLLVEALRSVDVPLSTIGYRNTVSRQRYQFDTDEVGTFRTLIVAVNAELNEPVRNTFGDYFFRDTYVVGQWFWELEQAPKWYKPAFKYVNELWAPTRFIEEMLRREAPKEITVTYMPLPLVTPTVMPGITRQDLDLDNRFMFLFTFDFMSVMKRKNPLGLVEAFKKAFSPGEGPMLVLKCINGETRRPLFAELQQACQGRSDIVIMNKYLDSDKSAALMALCDCYVSLHRSEGLGLTIAEAMSLGKPVIATAYSGNLDFMTPETSFMVPWTKVKVGSGAEAYDPRASWAEPDTDVAAEMMRQVYLNPAEARNIGLAARKDVHERFTMKVCGTRMKNRLSEIWEMNDEA